MVVPSLPLSSAMAPREGPYSEFCRLMKEYRMLRSLAQSETTKLPSQCARQIAPSPSLQTASCWGQIEHSEQWDGAQRPLVEAEADVDSDQLQMKPLSAIYPAATTVDSYALLKKKQHHGVIQDWGSIAHSPSVSCGSRTYPGQRNGSNINTIKRSSTKRTGSTYLGLGGTKKISALGASGKRSSKSCRGQHHHDSHKKTPIARPTHIHQEDCGNKKPLNNLAAAMAIAFSSSDRRRDSAAGAGVSVSAIRNIYRARHKQQEARQQQERERGQALNEIHQTWKVRTLSNSSHLRVSDKKFHGAEVVQGCLIDQPSSGPSSNEVLSDEHKRHREGGGERGYGVASNSDRSVEYDTRPTRTYTATALAYPQIFRDTPKEHCCLFDNLNWREVLQNDSYRVSLVRDIRQLLRAGRTVQVRARGAEGPSFSGSVEERSGWKDCQLMLRNMYMQAVQYCAEPALPPILREPKDPSSPFGEYFVSMTMEPARRYCQRGLRDSCNTFGYCSDIERYNSIQGSRRLLSPVFTRATSWSN